MVNKRKKFLPFLILGIIFLIFTSLLIIYIDPETGLDVGIIIDPLFLFFMLLFLTLFSLGTFVFGNPRQGLIIGSLIITVLFLQALGLNSPLYTAILILISILIEAMFWKKS